MKSFKAFIFLGFMTAIGLAVYYFFEQDWSTIWAYLNGKTTVNPLKKYAFYNMITGSTGGGSTGGGSTGGGSTGGGSTGGGSTGGGSTGGGSTGGGSTGGGSTGGGSTGGGSTGGGSTGGGSTGGGSSTGGGGADFRFVEKSNGQSLPNKPQGNGYTLTHFPSHCRVCTQVENTPMGAFAHCEWGLKNSQGEEIAHLLDTIGGFHPNFFEAGQRAAKGNDYYGWVDEWATKFVPFGPFQNPINRGNNHFDEYKKYLKDDSYTFWYKNKSNTRHTVTAGFIRASNGEGDMNMIIEPYEFTEKILNISWNGNEDDAYKINTNNYLQL